MVFRDAKMDSATRSEAVRVGRGGPAGRVGSVAVVADGQTDALFGHGDKITVIIADPDTCCRRFVPQSRAVVLHVVFAPAYVGLDRGRIARSPIWR